MLEQYIELGQRIEIQPVSRHIKEEDPMNVKRYSSKVYDIVSDEKIEILMPFEQSKLVLLPVGEAYTLFFYTRQGLYECTTRIVDRYKSNNAYILVMELTTNLKKYQRREFYRFSCAIGVDTRIVTDEELDAKVEEAVLLSGYATAEEFLAENGEKEDIRLNLMYDKVYQFLADNSEVMEQ